MKFRTRLLILLLVVSLLPLGLSFVLQRLSTNHFGTRLADDTRAFLNKDAVSLLHTLVDNYSRILNRDQAIALLTLENQAQEVERRLSAPPPVHPRPIYFATDYLTARSCPADLVTEDKYTSIDATGTPHPIPVSYSQQTVFLAGGTTRQQVETELQQLSTMPDAYKMLHDIQPDLFFWQYTTLRSGLHISYPGKGGYPASYEPRQRQWYKDAILMGKPTQHIMNDVTTGLRILTFSKPVYDATGKIAGVTALDINYQQFFADWSIPADWQDATSTMILVYHEDAPNPNKQLEILLSNRTRRDSTNWHQPVEHKYLNITDPQLQIFQEDLIQGQSAVRKITYDGQTALWAYGVRDYDKPFPLVIVPYNKIMSRSLNAEKYIHQQITLSLKIGALLTILVVIATTLLAVIRSRKVTEPIMQLATTANRLAAGDFDARVEIHTGDELEELGHIFNRMGENLKEREKMKHSLELAKEIQQHFLPAAAPTPFSFDMAAKSLYCDETGGDYFDFIPLCRDKNKLAIAVGDVSGHGVGSALLMATARGILHSLVDRFPDNLTTLVQKLNTYLCQGTASSNFMTLFYAIIDSQQRTFSWVSAGHAPWFLYQNGRVKELGSSGIPLGIMEGADFEIAPDITLQQGDIVLIGTDGIWEAQNCSGQMFGTARVTELLTRHAQRSAHDIIAEIITELDYFQGDMAQTDDITLMVIKAP